MYTTQCEGCNVQEKPKSNSMHSGWWMLNNYHGFSGWFCPDCYENVSHNSLGEPNHPREYMKMLLTKDYRNKQEQTNG